MKSKGSQRLELLSAALRELRRGRLAEAERYLLLLLDEHKDDREALEELVAIYERTARRDQAENALRMLAAAWPDAPEYGLRLAALLERRGKLRETEAVYRELIDHLPGAAVARFNFACFLRRRGRLEEALRQHQQALDLRIDQPEEVLSNMAAICAEQHRDDAARDYLHRAIAVNPQYKPALFNLALYHEEFGERDRALQLFERILDLDPTYYDALIRIAHARPVTGSDDPVVRKLRRALRRSSVDALVRESLHFALGKALDDCGHYDEAFQQFELGNRCSAGRVRPYDQRAQEDRVALILQTFSPEWLARAQPVSDRPLVFITGMFRSGSTLFEQVLAAHPRVTAGGEIDYFGRRLARSAVPFPASIAELGPGDYRQLGTDYLEYLDRTFPGGNIVTNKRPDAFAYLGLLKAMFPKARFINTVRDPLDTCLSIYFQQFDGQVAYANDLEHTAHYYSQYQRLMEHWKRLFGANIFNAVYDEFIIDPLPTTQGLLRFLDLEWHEGCLDFQALPIRVRTASVWQVRQPVYRKSSGRWRNYERHLESIHRLLTPDVRA